MSISASRLRIRASVPFLAALLALACGPRSGDVDIDVDVANSLRGDLEVVAAVGKKPGETNPVEIALTIANAGAIDRKVTVSGTWRDDRGGQFGGSSSVHFIPAGTTVTITAGTRSRQASRFDVEVTPDALSADAVIDRAIVEAASGVGGHGIAYTPTPTSQQIPAWPVRGLANGKPFEARTIAFVWEFDKWRLKISDVAFDPIEGIALARSNHPDLQTIDISLPNEPAPAALFEKPMSWGDGIFQIKRPANAGTTSWNSDKAWVIEFTDWQRAPLDDTRRQLAGKASGRLYICFKGSSDLIQNSFVAGEFSDVPIVYYGKAG